MQSRRQSARIASPTLQNSIVLCVLTEQRFGIAAAWRKTTAKAWTENDDRRAAGSNSLQKCRPTVLFIFLWIDV